MKEKIKELKCAFEGELEKAQSLKELDDIKVKYLGKKGPITALLHTLGKIADKDERKEAGQLINTLKVEVAAKLESEEADLELKELSHKLQNEKVDISLPGKKHFLGKKHPVISMVDENLEILKEMGFSVQYSPEIESEFYNYGGLNYPPDHPARDMQDTFYLSPDMLLRSHTTAIQQRIMESSAPPIRICTPGKCYRNETITARSHVFFYQIDVLYIDKGVTFADLLSTIKTFYSKIFKKDVEIRVRPSYFPFVEPGMEVDIRCTGCDGEGCKICKNTGWLEVAGAGMVHEEVLRAGGLDPDEYSGFAWGGGVERLVMLRHGINDIRLFTENDIRFLKQFN